MRTILLLSTAAMMLSMSLAAQRRPAGSAPQEQKVGVAIDLRVNDAPYTFKGQAVCQHLAKGSIYDTPAERWSVQHDATGQNMNLTLWRPLKGGGDMVTLSLQASGKRHDVDTVKGPKSTQTTGSGSVRFAPEGGGGTFAVEATAASGAKISGTVKCDAFTASQAVAGN